MTVLNTATEQMQIEADRAADATTKARIAKTIDDWKALVARYDDDEKSNEGRKQLMERAKHAEESREVALARYHNYEYASAAVPDRHRAGLGGSHHLDRRARLALRALGVVGLALTGLGLWAPHALHVPRGTLRSARGRRRH